MRQIFDECKDERSGNNAQYIPQLARVNSEQFALAVQTVDGQVWSIGDINVPFTLQSCSKPLTYCIAEGDRGEKKIARHVGHEPSGRKFNAFELDERIPSEKKPFNPMINAGAIVTASLLKPELQPSERFDYVQSVWKKLADRGDGNPTTIGFDNATYLSEVQHADRNFALSYFMKGEGVFDSSVNTNEGVRTHLEFYLQVDIVFFFFAKGSQQYLNGHTSFLLLIEALLDDRHHRGHGFCSICSRKRGHQSHHEGENFPCPLRSQLPFNHVQLWHV